MPTRSISTSKSKDGVPELILDVFKAKFDPKQKKRYINPDTGHILAKTPAKHKLPSG